MRKRGRDTSGISLGTVLTLLMVGFVIAGAAWLFPRLVGDIDTRVNPARVGVAFQSVLNHDRAQQSQGSMQLGATEEPPLSDLSTSVPAPTQPAEHTLTLTAAGVISIDGNIQKACTSEAGYGFEALFSSVAKVLQGEVNLATLRNLVIANEKLTDVNMPVDALAAVRNSGFNVLSTGFPGALNSGVDGLAATINAIGQNGMTAYGTFPSAESRKHVVTVDIGGMTVAFLSFQGELSAAGKRKTTKAEQDFVIAPLTLPAISADISAARAAGAKIVIVSLCWGKDGAATPTKTQIELAQGIAEARADVILGTGTGTVQPVSILRSRRADATERQTLCAFSLGNLLVSDRSDRSGISGAILHVNMRYHLADDSLTFEQLTFTPTYVWRGRIDGKNAYRVLPSNAAAPDYVDEDQQAVMERSLTLIRDVFAQSPVREAQ